MNLKCYTVNHIKYEGDLIVLYAYSDY